MLLGAQRGRRPSTEEAIPSQSGEYAEFERREPPDAEPLLFFAGPCASLRRLPANTELLIVAPSAFKAALAPLVTHKNATGIRPGS